jgi:hypothetical protein
MGFRTSKTESGTPKLLLIAAVKGTAEAANIEGCHAAIIMRETPAEQQGHQSLSELFGRYVGSGGRFRQDGQTAERL